MVQTTQPKTTSDTIISASGPDYDKQLTAIAVEKAAHQARVGQAKKESRAATRKRK
jgi:hypothetical protein